MIVAPNSPSARAHASTAPPASAGSASGTVTRANVRSGPIPSVADASSYTRSTDGEPGARGAHVERRADEELREHDRRGGEREPHVQRVRAPARRARTCRTRTAARARRPPAARRSAGRRSRRRRARPGKRPRASAYASGVPSASVSASDTLVVSSEMRSAASALGERDRRRRSAPARGARRARRAGPRRTGPGAPRRPRPRRGSSLHRYGARGARPLRGYAARHAASRKHLVDLALRTPGLDPAADALAGAVNGAYAAAGAGEAAAQGRAQRHLARPQPAPRDHRRAGRRVDGGARARRARRAARRADRRRGRAARRARRRRDRPDGLARHVRQAAPAGRRARRAQRRGDAAVRRVVARARQGARRRRRCCPSLGYGVVSLSALYGGAISLDLQIGVNRTSATEPPRGEVDVGGARPTCPTAG